MTKKNLVQLVETMVGHVAETLQPGVTKLSEKDKGRIDVESNARTLVGMTLRTKREEILAAIPTVNVPAVNTGASS